MPRSDHLALGRSLVIEYGVPQLRAAASGSVIVPSAIDGAIDGAIDERAARREVGRAKEPVQLHGGQPPRLG